jgi:hypothetical protein
VTNASMVWTLLCVATNIDVREITHIPGVENGRCDRLSRRGITSSMTVREEAREMGIDEGVEIEVNGDEEVMRLLRLCNPRRRLESDSDFIAFWTDVRDAVNNLSTIAFLTSQQLLQPPPLRESNPVGIQLPHLPPPPHTHMCQMQPSFGTWHPRPRP